MKDRLSTRVAKFAKAKANKTRLRNMQREANEYLHDYRRTDCNNVLRKLDHSR